ncbi:MAG: hypothetical protein KDB47_18245 [Mycobacterium sp.]|nr:hypothetical protein [Mycobacterium sp.]
MVKKVPLAAAVAFAVLSVASTVVVPPGPGVERPGSDVVDHITAHAGMIRLRALLTALALLALVVILGYARDRLNGPAGQVFLTGSAVFIAQTGIRTWLDSGLALHPSALDPVVARVVADIGAMWGPLLSVAAITLGGPVIWAARRGRFPRWLSVIAAVVVVEQFVAMLTIIGPVGSFIAPGGPMNVYLGGLLFGVFLFALGLAVALRDPGRDSGPDSRSEQGSAGVVPDRFAST